MFIGPEDGSPLDASRAAKIDIFAADGLMDGANGWSKLTGGAFFENGQLRLDDPIHSSRSHRFFRVEERP